MRLTRRLATLIAVILLLAACGTGAVPSTAAEGAPDAGGGDVGGGGGDDACLNTVEEVSAALDVEVTEAENTATPGGGAGCIYYTDKAAFEIAYTIGLSAGGSVAQQIFDSFAADDAEEVSGIGDEALWYGGGLVIRKGDRLLSIGAVPTVDLDEAALRAILTDLGRAAADRL